MSIRYKDIVPWGRNFDEYKRMFNLTGEDLKSRILGCGDGPASFNYECNSMGGNVISIDPIYELTKEEISRRIDETYDDVLAQTGKNMEKFIWTTIKSLEQLARIRMDAMKNFLNSYDKGKAEGRYIPAALPSLPFKDMGFDISLSSHFLFLYSDHLTYEFHSKAIREMLRVSRQARIFPLLDVNAVKSPYVTEIIKEFKDWDIKIKKVDYEFQKGGNELLIINR